MDMAVMVASAFPYAIATIFPSIEYVDEKQCVGDVYGSEVVVPIGPPVWRSQLVSSRKLPNCDKKRLFGEKLSHWAGKGGSKVWSLSRVVESRTSAVKGFSRATAMNLLHGDHAAATTKA